MKNFSATEKPIEKPHCVALEKELPHKYWTPIVAIVLTGLVSYLTYTLCSHIPAMDCSTAVWPVFG